MRLAPWVALLLVAGLGCVGPLAPRRESAADAATEVRQVVRQYLEAIYAGRAREAWALHSQDTNAGESFDEFAQTVALAKMVAGQTQVEQMGEPAVEGDRASVEVVQRLGGRTATHRFQLVREEGAWRIHNPRRG